MIQDLNDIAALGRKNPEQLKKINPDLKLLDQCAQMADDMASLYATASADRKEAREFKLIRDQAYTYLKEAVDAKCVLAVKMYSGRIRSG